MSNENSSDESSSDEMQVVVVVQPHADEPLAHTSDEDEDDVEDQDGLTPAVLRARFEDEVTVNDWSLHEWRMCERKFNGRFGVSMLYMEIAQVRQKLTFNGSIEHLKCITKHGDFSARINKTVLLQVGPLLRDKNGKGYRCRDGQTENQ